MPSQILDHRSQPIAAAQVAATRHPPGHVSNAQNRRMLQARFDSQFTTDQNRRHWAMADAMSIDASASWMVRRILRMRSRYEYHNNSYYQGMVDTVADYTIGEGPRLHMQTSSKQVNRVVEELWEEWAAEVGLGQTLHVARAASIYNGEAFALIRNNPNLTSPVKLDLFGVEADQVSSPLFGMYPSQYPDQYFDGVVLDPWGRPEKYHVLRQHPGAFGAFVIMGYEFDPWPAKYVLHDFKRTRPGQQRGIPETTPSLEDFADLRKFDRAVLTAAEQAARLAMTIETNAPANPDDADQPEPMDKVPLDGGIATVLPDGYKLNQLKAEQPTTTYAAYVNAKLQGIARCLNMPLMFVTLDARQANMSSAYIITQPFAKSVKTIRASRYEPLLNRLLDQFLTELLLIPGILPAGIPDRFQRKWRWPKIGNHADPMKVAVGREKALAIGATSIPQICAEDGDDWEEVQAAAAKSLGMSLKEYQAALRQRIFAASGTPTPATLDEEDDPIDPDDQSEPDPEPAEDDDE